MRPACCLLLVLCLQLVLILALILVLLLILGITLYNYIPHVQTRRHQFGLQEMRTFGEHERFWLFFARRYTEQDTTLQTLQTEQ